MNRYFQLLAMGAVLRQANEEDAGGTGAPDAEIARKLQARTIVGNIKKWVPDLDDKGEPTGTVQPLYQIWGHANATKRGETDFGMYVALVGRFEAIRVTPKVNKDTGEVMDEIDGTMFAGPICFLPEPMASMLASELEAEEPERDAAGQVVMVNGQPKMKRVVDALEFAFEIGVKATKTAVGYEYTTKPLIKQTGADPLANLRKRIPLMASRAQAALPTPPAAGDQAPAAGVAAAGSSKPPAGKGKGK